MSVALRQADAEQRASRRGSRFAALEFWRGHTVRDGGRFCMMPLRSEVVISGTADGVAHASGLRRCASPWFCPVCTPTIRERRAAEIDQGVANHLAAGGQAFLVSATFSHSLGDDLAELLTMAQTAWSKTWTMNSAVKRARGYVGQIRAWDTTYGANGFHPHIHAIVLLEAGAGSEWLTEIRYRWGVKVQAAGGHCDVTLPASPGWDVRAIYDSAGMSDYVCKVEGGWGAGLEVARSDRKRHGLTPAVLLERAVAGDTNAADLCRIYERATTGRRAIVWGRGLKELLGVVELSDDEVVNVEPSGVITVTVSVPAKAWRRLLRIGEVGQLLGAVGALAAGLDDGGCWRWPDTWILAWRRCSAIAYAA